MEYYKKGHKKRLNPVTKIQSHKEVVPPGIEPGTQGFSVLCSTNWAMAPTFTNRDLSFAGAKVILFSGSCKFFGKFLSKKDKKVYFCWYYPLFNVPLQQKSGFSAVGSARRSGRWGRWFESSNPDQKPSNVPIHRGFALVVVKMVGEISVSQELKNP